MSSLSLLRLRPTNSFSAACCSPVCATVRSYSGPNWCRRRSVRVRRLAESATTAPAMAIKIRAAMKNHAHIGISHSVHSCCLHGELAGSALMTPAVDGAAGRAEHGHDDAEDVQED